MATKLENMQRMLIIISKLKRSPRGVTREDLEDYVNRYIEDRGGKSVHLRTLQRDFNSINELLGFEVYFDKRKRVYKIVSEEEDIKKEYYERMLLDFDILSIISEDSNMHNFLLAEHHRPKDSEVLPLLIRSIKYSHPIEFNYVYVRKGGIKKKKSVLPHFLKEDQHRWYLLAYDGDVLKTFSVDAIRDLKVKDYIEFERRDDINVSELFKDCYGIWNDETIPVEEIELKYDALDGSFLKSLPLHSSQEILVDKDEEFIIRLKLRITNDFVMELLRRSRSLTVIKPQHLRERIKQVYKEALERNN